MGSGWWKNSPLGPLMWGNMDHAGPGDIVTAVLQAVGGVRYHRVFLHLG